MIRSQVGLFDGEAAPVSRFSLRVLSHLEKHVRQAVQGVGQKLVIRRIRLKNIETALVEWLGLRIFTHVNVQARQVVDGICDAGMRRARFVLPDPERAPKSFLSIFGLAQSPVGVSEAVEDSSYIRMIESYSGLFSLEAAQVEGFGFRIFPQVNVQIG